MARATRVDVLVIGAGPTGLMTAGELARRGVNVRIVDRSSGPSDLSRAIIVHARTLELFDILGISRQAIEAGLVAHSANIYDGPRRIAHIDFSHVDAVYQFTLDLAQDRTEAILRSRLSSFGTEVEWGTEVTSIEQDESGVRATLRTVSGDEEVCSATYLAGCDGSHSTARQALNLSFEGKSYEMNVSLLEAKITWPLAVDQWHFFLSARGSLLCIPLPDGIYRILAEVPEALIGTLPSEPTLEEFQGYMRERGVTDATLSHPGWGARFHIGERLASKHRVGRVFLAGDAAHIHSPAGGQGMNTGLQDAMNLGWKLGLVVKGQAPETLLDSYEAERRPVAQHVLAMTDTITRLGERNTPIVRAVRDRLLPIITRVPAVTHFMTNTMAEVDVNYRDSQIVVQSSPQLGGPTAGEIVRDATPVGTPDGRLFAAFRHPAHTLLVFEGSDRDAAGALVAEVGGRFGGTIVAYRVTMAPDARGDDVITDPEGAAHQRYGAKQGAFFLVRPDGYIAMRGALAEGNALIGYVNRTF